MEAWKRMEIEGDNWLYWSGESNIADITTKGKARLQDVEVSEWQLKMEPATFSRKTWPILRT